MVYKHWNINELPVYPNFYFKLSVLSLLISQLKFLSGFVLVVIYDM